MSQNLFATETYVDGIRFAGSVYTGCDDGYGVNVFIQNDEGDMIELLTIGTDDLEEARAYLEEFKTNVGPLVAWLVSMKEARGGI
jgi:hypothetical protein